MGGGQGTKKTSTTTSTGDSGTSSDSSSSSTSSSTTTSNSSTSSTSTGQAGARTKRSGNNTQGSSSTTTPANNQSVVTVGSANYSIGLGNSSNPLTMGAGSGSNVSASNVQQSQNTTGQANVTNVGMNPLTGKTLAVWESSIGQTQYAMLVAKYGESTAQRLREQTYYSTGVQNIVPATNTDNQYIQNENRAITNAEKRQTDFVNTNKFMANPHERATAPIPDVITVSTPLYQQAGEKENPLTILEGNKFISPSQQFLPQVNEQVAPRPEYGAFTNNPYIGVHANSDIAPNADLGESQRKTPMDYLIDIKNHKYFPLAVVGIIGLIVLSMFGGARVSKARGGGGRGVFRSGGGSGQPIITVVK